MKNRKGFNFYFTQEEHDELKILAARTRLTMTDLVREALAALFYERRKLELVTTTKQGGDPHAEN